MKLEGVSVFRLALSILLTVVLFGCDYATKSAAKATLEGAGSIPVAPGMLHGAVELRYVENDDIAFSALQLLGIPRSPELLIALSAIALATIVAASIVARIWHRTSRTPLGQTAPAASAAPTIDPADLAGATGLALVLSGALGNIVDRIVRGYVVDFIHVKGWPVFNVAVVLGAALIAFSQLRRRERESS